MAWEHKQVTFDRNLAVVIGIDDYQNGISSLGTAANDARALAKLLREEHHYEQVWEFIDPIQLDSEAIQCSLATLINLEELLTKTLLAEVKENDRLVFYFAGHGIALNGNDGPQGYLIPQDARLGDVMTYFPMPKIETALTQLSCRHCLVILDCCFAGAFCWSSTRKLCPVAEVIHKERYDRFIEDRAWQVITSAGCDQYANDVLNLRDQRGTHATKTQHSPFAAALIEALSGEADIYPSARDEQPAGDGVITATELYLYLRDCVELETEAQNTRQTPGLSNLKNHDKGEYIFLVPGRELDLPPAPQLDEVLQDETKNPYRGLKAYDKAHQYLFFGRDQLIEKLCDAVCARPLVVVLGASGSGKSSLVKAGLIPHLENPEQPQQDRTPSLSKHKHQHKHQPWSILNPIRPGKAPLDVLEHALRNVASPLADYLDETPHLESKNLINAVINWSLSHSDSKLLLVIDQFEELAMLPSDNPQRQAFLTLLAETLQSCSEQFHVVLTLRSDFEPHLRNTPLEPFWKNARLAVPAMTREDLREAITKPAAAKVVCFKPFSLIDQLIDDVANMPGALPLLSFTLSELYLKLARRYLAAQEDGGIVERFLTQEDYDQLGGVTRALTQRADHEYETLINKDSTYQDIVPNVLLRMVAVEGELARRRVSQSELQYPASEQEKIDQIITQFSEARLLTSGTDMEGNAYIEPAHDVLVRGWKKLVDWRQENLANLVLQRELTSAANDWAMSASRKDLWDDDHRLPQVKHVRKLKGSNWLNLSESDFVDRSIQRRRRKQIGILGSFVIVVLIILGMRFAEQKRQQETHLKSLLLLAMRSGLELEGWTQGNEKLLLQRYPSASPLFVLQAVLDQISDRESLLPWDSSVGSQLETLENRQQEFNGNIRQQSCKIDIRSGVVCPEGGQEIAVLRGNRDWFEQIVLSPVDFDGQRIATLGKDHVIRLWDLRGRQIAELTAPQVPPTGATPEIAFDSSGTFLMIQVGSNSIVGWKIQSLNDLLNQGCQWLSDHQTDSQAKEISRELQSYCSSVTQNNPDSNQLCVFGIYLPLHHSSKKQSRNCVTSFRGSKIR